MSVHRFQVAASDSQQRLDRFLADHVPSLSRSQVERLIAQHRVTVDGARSKAGHRLTRGEVVEASLPLASLSRPVAESLPLHVVYEDEDLLAVDKPAGMVVHPAPGHETGTLVSAILSHRPDLASIDRAGIAHRLDRYTSGLLLVAKTEKVLQALQRQFRCRQVQKAYLALVEGRLMPVDGRIEAPLRRDPSNRQRMAVVTGGRPASTTYRVCEHYEKHTLLTVRPETGRTHQIRVHLAAIGYPVAGDRVYGRRSDSLGLHRHFLHAWRLGFTHPSRKDWIDLEASLPKELEQVLAGLGPI